MNYIRSWLGTGSPRKESAGIDNSEHIPVEESSHINKNKNEFPSDEVQSNSNSEFIVRIDPEVAEFFKDFPEPYRKKAIERFSRREGLNRFDVFRKLAMDYEMQAAMNGTFPEDRREWRKELQDQYLEESRAKHEEAIVQFENREIPEWEQKLLTVIPLQKTDSMARKLFQTVNVSLLGCSLLYTGVQLRKSASSWRRAPPLVGGVGLFVMLQMAAAARLMDLGPFDYSVDSRSVYEKEKGEIKEMVDIILHYFHHTSDKPTK